MEEGGVGKAAQLVAMHGHSAYLVWEDVVVGGVETLCECQDS